MLTNVELGKIIENLKFFQNRDSKIFPSFWLGNNILRIF